MSADKYPWIFSRQIEVIFLHNTCIILEKPGTSDSNSQVRFKCSIYGHGRQSNARWFLGGEAEGETQLRIDRCIKS